MSNIAEKLERLLIYKNSIKEAIISKGIDVSDNMAEYAEAILRIGGGEPTDRDYLMFEANDGDLHIGVREGTNIDKYINLEYSFDKENWDSFTYDGVDVPDGSTVYFKADGVDSNSDFTFTLDNYCDCHGDIKSLVGSNFEDIDEIPEKAFQYLFQGCSLLKSAPDIFASYIGDFACNMMYHGCESLQECPILAASYVGYRGYSAMFVNCPFSNTPDLPAYHVGGYGYENMFIYCNNLDIDTLRLPATEIEESSYKEMFVGGNAPRVIEIHAEQNGESDTFKSMFLFNNWDKLEKIYCNIRYNNDGSEITDFIGENWINSNLSIDFYKNQEWSGPTVRNGNTIPEGCTVYDWTTYPETDEG